jgi:hypothetical protein
MVSGTLTIPAAANGKIWAVFIDTDTDPDNGHVATVNGHAGSGTTVDYDLGKVAGGTYFVFAAVCVVSDCENDLVDGDYFGYYGTPLKISSLSPSSGGVGTRVVIMSGMTANATVPSSGAVTFDINLGVYDAQVFEDETVEVTVDNISVTQFVVESTENSVVLLMPNTGSAGNHDVKIATRGLTSDAKTWNQQGVQDPSDPNNDDPHAAPAINLPYDAVGSFLAGDWNDCFRFTLSTQTTVDIKLDWNNSKDLDVMIMDQNEDLACAGAGSTYEKPEEIDCALPAGDYWLCVVDADAALFNDFSLVSYRVTFTR